MKVPHIIKYMGSKRNIIDFVVDSINEVVINDQQRLYDVFGGSAVVSGAFRNRLPITCNDIQAYTGILAGTYLNNYNWNEYDENISNLIVQAADEIVSNFVKANESLKFEYSDDLKFTEVLKLEKEQQKLIGRTFNGHEHLFVKNFSGTYWSYYQCVWIDAIAQVAQSPEYRNTPLYNVIMSSLMFAMAYCTQSTGHYAQYRDLTKSNMKDIIAHRKREILPYFLQKFEALKDFYDSENVNQYPFDLTQLDFEELLENMQQNSIVYADPPYQFVHYSRFYHALETLVKYDYPEVRFKGRYRTDRHQSPFCIRTKVKTAFESMFQKVFNSRSTLVLSYSDTGMIEIDTLLTLANNCFRGYNIEIRTMEHKHSTMGRLGDKSRDVQEAIIICRP